MKTHYKMTSEKKNKNQIL